MITPNCDLRRASLNAAGARVSVINLRLLESRPMTFLCLYCGHGNMLTPQQLVITSTDS